MEFAKSVTFLESWLDPSLFTTISTNIFYAAEKFSSAFNLFLVRNTVSSVKCSALM